MMAGKKPKGYKRPTYLAGLSNRVGGVLYREPGRGWAIQRGPAKGEKR